MLILTIYNPYINKNTLVNRILFPAMTIFSQVTSVLDKETALTKPATAIKTLRAVTVNRVVVLAHVLVNNVNQIFLNLIVNVI